MIPLDTPVSRTLFVSVDVETTGLDAGRDVIVEIGAVKFQGGVQLDEFSTLVSTNRAIPQEAERVHGISQEMLAGQPRIDEAMSLFRAFAGESVLVEHSFRAFDVRFLEAALGGRFEGPYINTCTLSRKLFPFHRSHSLAECCRRHNIGNDQAHRALSDARATAQLLRALLDAGINQYPRLQDLVNVATVDRDGGRERSRRSLHHRS